MDDRRYRQQGFADRFFSTPKHLRNDTASLQEGREESMRITVPPRAHCS
ncbi:hypothetical protein SAMN04244581_03059 [Paracoccus denitrificans]|jgi:hypothetical protein|nr:hypothetical protein [Paracoccus denitrificans]MDK8873911.1 hypothetical protein [Paracoccus sp. SSJ]SDJ05740.1 hypothetical protein SAMN04244581_03059 [Paracoccus denitrificans]SFR12957.1 hypothetical protein SAMN04244569_03048 [Paracoccus denitrificans]